MRNKLLILPLIFVLAGMSGCMKEYLDLKRDKSQVVPDRLEDFFAILENSTLNTFTSHVLGEIGADDFHLLDQQWKLLTNPVHKNGYVWADEIYEGETWTDWNRGYEKILIANFVMEGLASIAPQPKEKLLRDQVLGSAFFIRGANLFMLAQLFCDQYDARMAASMKGLPLRTTSNINERYSRADLSSTYDLIINDLKKATHLLPHETQVASRPSKSAAYGMLAKVFLQMGDYQQAFSYADSSLAINSALLDFNGLDSTLAAPFPMYGVGNPEIIYYSSMPNAAILSNSRLIVDSVLHRSFHRDDLRKAMYFFINNGNPTFKGSYSGVSVFLFSGLTVSEQLLIRAECAVRMERRAIAVRDLEFLLSNRYRSVENTNLEAIYGAEDLLRIVLLERRKELVYRGIRWHDLRRFGQDPSLATPLRRVIEGKEYQLAVGSPKWVWPIPPDVISLGRLEQNAR